MQLTTQRLPKGKHYTPHRGICIPGEVVSALRRPRAPEQRAVHGTVARLQSLVSCNCIPTKHNRLRRWLMGRPLQKREQRELLRAGEASATRRGDIGRASATAAHGTLTEAAASVWWHNYAYKGTAQGAVQATSVQPPTGRLSVA